MPSLRQDFPTTLGGVTGGTLKDKWLFFPEWSLWIYLPLHIYVFFKVAMAAYPGQQLAYALIPLFVFALFSGVAAFFVLTVGLYKMFGKRTCAEVLRDQLRGGARKSEEILESATRNNPSEASSDDNESSSRLSDEYSVRPVSETSDADRWVRNLTRIRGGKIGQMLAVFFLFYFLYTLYLNRHLFELLK